MKQGLLFFTHFYLLAAMLWILEQCNRAQTVNNAAQQILVANQLISNWLLLKSASMKTFPPGSFIGIFVTGYWQCCDSCHGFVAKKMWQKKLPQIGSSQNGVKKIKLEKIVTKKNE